MATYQIQINERMTAGKQAMEFLKSAPEAVSLMTTTGQAAVDPGEIELYKSLRSTFHAVRNKTDGKKRKQTLDGFLDELPYSYD
jgi:hypothetical protein